MRKFRWQETVPNYVMTSLARTARVRHAAQVIEGVEGTTRALCGMKPKFGWQATTLDLPVCDKCNREFRNGAYMEVK